MSEPSPSPSAALIQAVIRPDVLEQAAYPVASLKRQKYWSPVGRVDNVYGDRNLFCSCVPVSELAG